MEPTAEVTSELFRFPSLPHLPAGEAGWEDIVREHEGMLRARIWRLFERLGQQPGRELVEEILQEVYCRLFEDALRRWRGTTVGELLAYLGIIAERTVVDHLRVVQADKRTGYREVYLGRRIEQIADPRDPERDLLHAETQAVLLRRCREMPSRRGRRNEWVARLALLEGWTNQEIAQAAGGRLSPANVACLVHRLRQRLVRPTAPPRVRRRRRRRAV